MTAETEHEQRKRRHQRALFDGVASLYEATRPAYPRPVIEFIAATAGLGDGSAVLEIGCGTGQLTSALARSGYDVIAIDIGPSMIAAARQHPGSDSVSFQVTSFEEFQATSGSFDLIISAAAFHWLDPDIKYAKSARLLRPGGWLAVLGSEERYDDPVGAALDAMWIARNDDDGAWVTQRTDARTIVSNGLFGDPVQHVHAQRTTLPASTVIGLENTRATSLSWPEDVRSGFTGELRDLLRPLDRVELTLQTTVTMARVMTDDRADKPGSS